MIFNFKSTSDAKTLGGHSADEFLKTGDTASNSEKLGGRGADEFAKKDDLSGYVSKTGESNIVGKLRVNGNSVLDSVTFKESALPIHGGGTVNGNVAINGNQFSVISTKAETVRSYIGNSKRNLMFVVGEDGSCGLCDNTNSKFIFNFPSGVANEFLHSGNSAKVHIGTAAPSDTSALWIDISA